MVALSTKTSTWQVGREIETELRLAGLGAGVLQGMSELPDLFPFGPEPSFTSAVKNLHLHSFLYQ